MEFEWDKAKSQKCFAECGFDFAFAARVFDGRFVAFEDARRLYGETRKNAIGLIEGLLYTVTFTDRAGACRIISARRASKQERRIWREFE